MLAPMESDLHISNENGRYIGSIRPSVTPHPHQLIYPSSSSSRTHWLPQTTKQLIRNVIINDWLIVIYRSSITCSEPQLHHRQRCLYQTAMKQPPHQQPIPIDAVWESNPYPALVQYITRSAWAYRPCPARPYSRPPPEPKPLF